MEHREKGSLLLEPIYPQLSFEVWFHTMHPNTESHYTEAVPTVNTPQTQGLVAQSKGV